MSEDRFNVDIAAEMYGSPPGGPGQAIVPGVVNENIVGKPPPAIDMAKNLYRDTIAWAQSGFEVSEKDEIDRRLEICNLCEFFKDGRCTICGCFMALKARLATGKCPKGKW
jgi:hypothetical protein